LAGAGVIQPLPLLQPVLFGFAAVLLIRAVMFPFLRPIFPGSSDLFWYVSSGAIGVLGIFLLSGALWLKK
jgi:hypothetical protein